MSYTIDKNIEYFLGYSLPEKETELLTLLRQELEDREVLSSPPHITVKPPFLYYFEKPLTEQLAKWARRQRPLSIRFEKIGTFKHKDYATLFLSPERGRKIKELEQDLSNSIKFLPTVANSTPHLTIANRIPFSELESIKKRVRELKLSLEFEIDNITLFEHQKMMPWDIKEIFHFSIPERDKLV